ncbi:tRNA preQ1(34) S-adenosylmethionine ribosyltransferase-isomerase QueA [Skermanella rosea]|uniref:tRNA preQ1(34) S-adenosylmethionine ribosyltransferase-isomerase QueA n=1 Tax=Skermanella rosea TaxID=1817965 RepID=UPI001932580A|nr:tRNA preQ1(34) S-adenosylmethionine ribosyltransferase-isomerase QueA [Skermanella rosea]UEM02919.1 tRNA preQ1(34) S-adenosylmethionine ribosyltransferase-isomerase QueA [Skermanella rosea]
MRTADFDFDLPPDRIADQPARPRDVARLLHVGQSGAGDAFTDHIVRDLPGLLNPGDLLVYNDTRVIPARLTGRRGEVRVEVTLHKREGADTWHAFAKPGKRLRAGDTIDFAPGLSAEVRDKREGGDVELRFSVAGSDLMAALHRHGVMPLPPYIRRPDGEAAEDRQDYQTVFAAREGAVAAPTAGLHFTPDLLARLDERGIRRVPVTLHVGAGTFLPVKVEDIRDHRMHAEWGEIGRGTADAVAEARRAGGRVVAVGTTSLRLLESAAAEDGTLAPFSGDTDIFITPGYRFKIVDLLLTNFHLPRSTLFMLVSAFAGLDRMRAAYAHAIASGYRFYSYGDTSLLERTPRE